MDHIDIAVHAVVHNSDIDPKEIALRTGVSYQTLLNKANPATETHKLTLREAVAIQMVTGNHAIHRAAEIELQKSNQASCTECVLSAVLTATKEHGDVVAAIKGALEDSRFTLREREQCQKEIDEAINALKQLSASIVAHG